MLTPALRAGLRYGMEAFALGLILGVVRVTVIEPEVGALLAVLCEIPVMLAAMAWRASEIIRRTALSTGRDRIVMGSTGFGFLMICELCLGLALGTVPAEWLASFASPPGIAGLAGQMVYAVLPALVRRRD